LCLQGAQAWQEQGKRGSNHRQHDGEYLQRWLQDAMADRQQLMLAAAASAVAAGLVMLAGEWHQAGVWVSRCWQAASRSSRVSI
jgi:hypothetical protein